MIKIIILKELRNEIYKTFKKDSLKIYSLINKLKTNPQKSKVIGLIGSISLRELKFKSYRFYFIIEGHKLMLFTKNNIQDLLIRFIKMSNKNNQQKTIDKIKTILKTIK